MDQTRPVCQRCNRHRAIRGLAVCLNCQEKLILESNNRAREEGHQGYLQSQRDGRRGQS